MTEIQNRPTFVSTTVWVHIPHGLNNWLKSTADSAVMSSGKLAYKLTQTGESKTGK